MRTPAIVIIISLLAACSGSDGAGSGSDSTSDVSQADAATSADVAQVADVTGSVDAEPGPPDVAPEVEGPTPHATLGWDLLQPGPNTVGYRTWDTTYVVPTSGAERTTTVHAWYPSTATEGDPVAYLGIFTDEGTWEDVPAADPADPAGYPVLVHSHGHQAFGGSSAMIKRYLASHGWVSISPDHVGDMLSDSSTSETVLHYIERPLDITAALDSLAGLPEDDPLSRADTSRVVLSGHSRGVYTVWAVAGATYDVDRVALERPDATEAELDAFAAGFDDPRVVAAIPMAGTYRAQWFGDAGFLAVDLPVLALGGDADNHAGQVAQWDELSPLPMTWVELAGGCHETFGLGACDTLDVPRSDGVIGAYGLALGRLAVLDDASADTLGVLSGAVPVDPEIVTLQWRE